MVLFVECPDCENNIRVNTRHDIRLVANRDKTFVPVECPHCKTHFEIQMKLKVKTIKSIPSDT